jgi:hypothetical protein
MKSYGRNQLREYSTLFSRNEAQAWIKCNFQSLKHKIIRYDNDWLLNKKLTYNDYLKYIYNILESNYANEYIIKNSFLNEWLIPEKGHDNATIFNEFRVGKSVADLVIFNGTSKVFEIKTEFDSNQRLESQIENYKKIFKEVYLIVPKSKLSTYYRFDKSVGLISYKTKQKRIFNIERPCEANSETDYCTLMDILHSNEYKKIIKKYYGFLPEMTSFNQFEKCSSLMKKIPAEDLNQLFIEQMKTRNISNELSVRCFRELNQLSLSLNLNKIDKQKFVKNLNTCLND